MKIFSVLLVLLLSCGYAPAEEPVILDDNNVQVFIEVFPLYRSLVEKYGQEADSGNNLQAAHKYSAEVQSLLKKYNLDMEEFAQIMNRITACFSVIQMEKQGISPESIGLSNFRGITDAEINIVRKYSSYIEGIMTDR